MHTVHLCPSKPLLLIPSLVVLPLIVLPLVAQQTTVYGIATADGGQTTPTQAIVTYTAPSSAACSVQVSESSSMSPLVHDVDPILFPGSNLDSRLGSLTNGLQRTFIVGARRSDLASDNKHYSRALQANTLHYYQVTCGTTVLTGQFTTANPQLGNTYSDNPPFDATAFGNYGWPTIDWTDQSKVYVDPLTGIAVKRFSQPGSFGYVGGQNGTRDGGALPIYWDKNGAWSAARNITSGVSTTLATYSGTASDPIFVTYDSNNLAPDGAQVVGLYPWSSTLDNVQINLYGNGSAASAADRTVSVCLVFYDSTTCNSPWIDVVLPSTGSSTPIVFPANSVFPNAGFWAGWGVTPKRNDFGVLSATVSVNGSTVTASAGSLNTNWKTGAKYYIAGSSPTCLNNLCTVSSLANNQTMTIVESLGSPLTNVVGYGAAAGFLIKKKSGTGSVSISATSMYAVSQQEILPAYGGFQLCNENPVTISYAADGVTPVSPVAGYLCAVGNGYTSLYLLIPSTGETRLINPIYVDTTGQGTADELVLGNRLVDLSGTSDLTDPNSFYGVVQYNGGAYNGKHVILKSSYKAGPQCRYQAFGMGAQHDPLYATGSHMPGEDPTAYWWNGPQAKDSMDGLSSCMAYTITGLASAGRDVDSQIYASPNYKPVFGPVGSNGAMVGGKTLFAVGTREGRDLIYVFDLASGNLVLSTDSFSTYPMRWTGVHNSGAQGTDRYLGIGPSNGLGYYSNYAPDPTQFRGPYTVTPTAVWKSGAWSSDTSLPADNSISMACPAGPPAELVANGAVGNNCIQFQSKMACNTNPYNGGNTGQTEAGAYPCPYNPAYSMIAPLAPGDFIRPVQGLTPSYCNPCEFLQIVQVTPLGSNNWQFVANRTATANRGGCCANGHTTPEAWPNQWTLIPVTKCGVGFTIDATNTGQGFLATWTGGGHGSVGVGSSNSNATLVAGSIQGAKGLILYQQPLSPTPTGDTFLISSDVVFHGLEASTTIQSYPSNMQLAAASPAEKNWFLDFHHTSPSYGSVQESPVQTWTNFQSSATLVPGTNNVWKFAAPTGPVNFKTQPVIAYAGANNLQDVSSAATGNIITDSTLWQYCVVYVAGECRTGSAVNEAYLSVPFTGGSSPANFGYCMTNSLAQNWPCVNTLAANAAEIIQSRDDIADPTAVNWRRLGMGFMGPGRQYEFSTAVPDPTGKWAVFACNWCDGVRNDLFMAKLPPMPTTSPAQPGNDFEPLVITLPADSAHNLAKVRFGYGENGHPANLYCTTRQEDCSTTTDTSVPFVYESEGPIWQSCPAGCTIKVPTLPGRIVYYAIDRMATPVPTVPASLVCTPTSLGSNATSTCTITLNQVANTGGSSVDLSNNNVSLLVPATVSVPAGSTSATFNATTGALSTSQSAIITATLGSVSQSATISLVAPMTPASLTCTPTSLGPNASTTCSVALNQAAPTGGSSVALSDSSPLLTQAASVSVAAGSTSATFQATTAAISSNQTATITATLGGVSKSVSITLSAAVVTTPASLACTPTSLGANAASNCTVTLNQAAAKGGSSVTLSSSNAALTVPASVTVAAAATSAKFNATTTALSSSQTVTVTATLGGASKTATISLVATATTPRSLVCAPTSVGSNSSTNCTVTLSQAAPAGGSAVVLSANNAAITVPASATVAAGATSVTFTATTGAFSSTQSATITATLGTPQSANVSLFVPIQIDAGGGAAGTFVADTGYTGGLSYSTTANINTANVTNPAPLAVYQTERYGNFTYLVPNLAPGGAYTIRLHFAENYWTAAGDRLFNVVINGVQVLSNFDIFAAAGGANIANIQQLNANADSGGNITVQLVTVKDNAKLSGLEIQ